MRPSWMLQRLALRRPASVAGLLGACALAAALAAVLSHRATRLAGTDDVGTQATLTTHAAGGGGRLRTCQPGELLPGDAAAVRISLERVANAATPAVRVAFEARGRTVASGALAAGWSGTSPRVPLRRSAPARDVRGRLCVEVAPGGGFALKGAAQQPEAPQPPAAGLPGRFRADYVRAGRASWWSLAPLVVARMGRGHAPGGAWAVALVAVLTLAALAIAARLLASVAR